MIFKKFGIAIATLLLSAPVLYFSLNIACSLNPLSSCYSNFDGLRIGDMGILVAAFSGMALALNLPMFLSYLFRRNWASTKNQLLIGLFGALVMFAVFEVVLSGNRLDLPNNYGKYIFLAFYGALNYGCLVFFNRLFRR